MTKTPQLTDLRNTPHSPIPAGHEAGQRAVRPPQGLRAANSLGRWFNRTTGFWLGGVILGAAGCFWGASMPCEDPVGVALSGLWWGIYLGFLGASIGALLGLWAER